MLTFGRMTSYRAYLAKVETPSATPEEFIDNTPSLDYPKHPFSSELAAMVANLPEGFGEIALKRHLSIQTISLLCDVHEQDTSTRHGAFHPDDRPRKHLYTADKCVQLLSSKGMPELERMICGSLLAYTVQSQPSHQRTTVYDDTLMSFLAELAQYIYFNYEQDCLLWGTFCFSAIQSHLVPGRSDFFHHTIMRFRQSDKWTKTEAALKKFLWTDLRMEEWKEAWEDCIRTHRPQNSNTPSSHSSGGAASSKTSPG